MESAGLCECSINADDLVLRRTSSEDETSGFGIPVLSPPSTPADATGESRTHAVLQGTISALKKCNQQIVGLGRIPGLQNLVGVVDAVLKILQVVKVSFGGYLHLACKTLTLHYRSKE